jgi:site-specific DNA-cytosine methylase
MNAIGLTCGIGSMLIGAKAAGFRVIGNVEWRKYYHTGTFEKNFKGAFMIKSMSDLPEIGEIDLAMGHPECGNFSNLRTNICKYDDPGDIPLFIDLVKRTNPKFFVMDNLPKSLIAVPIKRYAEELPEYDLFPEWISNYHYGNTQFNRRRFFLIGAKRSQKFVFHPGEFDHQKRLIDVIRDLPKTDDIGINHVHWRRNDVIKTGWAAHQFGIKREGNKITYGELREFFRDYPLGANFKYLNKKGESKTRPGYCKIRLNHCSPVMTGGGSALDNHYREDTGMPLTQRERARIQGCPDDFIFYPLDFIHDPRSYACVYKQIGKFMPVEFCTFVARQIMAHLLGKGFRTTGKRIVRRSPFVDEAKIGLCSMRRRRKEWCEACWMDPFPMRGKNPPYIPSPTAQAHVGTVPGTPRRGKPVPSPKERPRIKPADAPKTAPQHAGIAPKTKGAGKTKGVMAVRKPRIFTNFTLVRNGLERRDG